MKTILTLCLTVTSCLIGCDNNTPPDTTKEPPNAPATPANIVLSQNPAVHFKQFITRFVDNVKSLAKEPNADKSHVHMDKFNKHEISMNYDVSKTDSLVSPFMAKATIIFHVDYMTKENEPYEELWEITFTSPAQEEQWVYRSPTSYRHAYGPKGSILKPANSLLDNINKDTIDDLDKEFHQLWDSAATTK